MFFSSRHLLASVALVGLLGGCASDGSAPFGGLTTSSIEQPQTAARVDPACVALNSKIDALRRDGVASRAAEAAAKGKSTTVPVKRASLAQLAELDSANAEFQAQCSTLGPRAATAPIPAPPPATVAAPTAKTAKAITKAPKAAAASEPPVAQ
jgi:hypothetical protein